MFGSKLPQSSVVNMEERLRGSRASVLLFRPISTNNDSETVICSTTFPPNNLHHHHHWGTCSSLRSTLARTQCKVKNGGKCLAIIYSPPFTRTTVNDLQHPSANSHWREGQRASLPRPALRSLLQWLESAEHGSREQPQY